MEQNYDYGHNTALEHWQGQRGILCHMVGIIVHFLSVRPREVQY